MFYRSGRKPQRSEPCVLLFSPEKKAQVCFGQQMKEVGAGGGGGGSLTGQPQKGRRGREGIKPGGDPFT